MSQIGIVIFGALAIYLVSLPETSRWQRWGYLSGLCSQPFWFWTTYEAQQWGLLCISIFYSYSWANGAWNRWVRK